MRIGGPAQAIGTALRLANKKQRRPFQSSRGGKDRTVGRQQETAPQAPGARLAAASIAAGFIHRGRPRPVAN